MKKLIFIVLLSLMSFYAFAQEKERYEVYCEIVYFSNVFSSKTVNIYYEDDKYNIEDNGVFVKLKSATQAMRLLSKKGWKLRSSFGVTGGNGMIPAEYHYIMVKEVSSDEEILDGLKEKK